MKYSAFLLASLFLLDGPEPPFLSQSKFDLTLNQPLVINRSPVGIREILQRISHERNVAILLDRRIDPSSKVDVEIDAPYLDDGLRALSKQLNSKVIVLADTLYIVPNGRSQSLLSYAHAQQTLLEEICNDDRKRLAELLKRRTVHWEMLATPQAIVAQICESYGLKISNIDQLPHDMWAQGDISYPNCVEALLMVLMQFDLSFEWVDAKTIKLIPLADVPTFEQFHRPKSMSIQEAISAVRSGWPDVEVTQMGTRLKIVAAIETHEAVSEILGEVKPRRTTQPLPNSSALANTPFSLKMDREPFVSLLKLLEVQGFEVRYDQEELTTAGVDLTKRVTFEAKDLKINELLTQPCAEVNLQHRVEGNVITLKPVK